MGVFRQGENWFIDYRVQGRRIQEKIGSNRKLAESVLSKRKTEIAEKRFLDIRKLSKESFRSFAVKYLDWVQGRIRGVEKEKIYIRRLNETFGDVPIYAIDLARVEKYMAQRLKEPKGHPFKGNSSCNQLSDEERRAKIAAWQASAKKVSKSQVNREVACLRRILNKAADWKLLPPSPLQGLKLYDEREFIRKRYLKPEEIRALLAECSPHIQDIVTFALYTGRRFGELVGMRWKDVDLENGYVYFPKTKKKEPDQVSLPPRAVELLTRLRGKRQGDWVFHTRVGGPVRDIRFGYQRALKAVGITDFRFHDLRHTSISYMMMNGIDLKTIAELVGHTTAEMVDKRYGHLSPDHKRISAEVFGSAMDRLCGLKPDGVKRVSEGPRGFGVETFWRLSGNSGDGPIQPPENIIGKDSIIHLLGRGSSTVEQSLRKR